MKAIKELDISGIWSFTPEDGSKSSIKVPGGGWLKQGFSCEAGTYETRVCIPDVLSGQVTKLELGAVNHYAEYYIGKSESEMMRVHEEVTAFTGQTVDLTGHVVPGETYLLRIFVRAWKGGRPVAPHCAEWCEAVARGIFRDAFIRVYPQVYISDIFVKTYTDNCGDEDEGQCEDSIAADTGHIKYEVWVANTSNMVIDLGMRGKLTSWNGDDLKYPQLPAFDFSVSPGETKKIDVGPVCWTPGKDSWWWPNVPYREGYRAKLHILGIIIEAGKEILHCADVRFGFRQICQFADCYRLNGKRINFRGDNLQVANYDRIDFNGKGDAIDTLPGFLPPSTSDPGWPRAVDNFLKLNYNVQREHMTPWTPYMIDICDEMGLMLIGESACRWDGFDMEEGRGFHEIKCLKDIVKRDRNHPSIIRWSVKNEPQCLEPRYHLELYEAVKEVDDTRPVSEDIVVFDRKVFDVRKVFSELWDKSDFTWIEHYITYDLNRTPYFTFINHNDAVIPMEERPYGLGEANWMRSSTHAGLVWFAATIALARAQGASDVRPYVLLSNWASSIPGVRTTDFLTEEKRHPVYGEDNLSYAWSHPGIRLLQKACNPVFAMDVEFWKLNRMSNAWGHFPVISPQLSAGSTISREIVVFNDEFDGTELKICWNVKEGSTSNRMYGSGETDVSIESGYSRRVDITFKTPVFNTFIFITLTVKKAGKVEYEDDLTCYEITGGEEFKPFRDDEDLNFI